MVVVVVVLFVVVIVPILAIAALIRPGTDISNILSSIAEGLVETPAP